MPAPRKAEPTTSLDETFERLRNSPKMRLKSAQALIAAYDGDDFEAIAASLGFRNITQARAAVMNGLNLLPGFANGSST